MTPEGSRPRVMFIDDEPLVLAGLRRTLRGELELATFDDPLQAPSCSPTSTSSRSRRSS
jgi:hypothetical protein